ncbi:Rha family transcriptional regulator [Paenibacillus elgii]|uniref:Rha family transcriptional regulator n=1 Tax=Paenibacillus elgii TaxID=189691 RepID=UPI000248C95D|nr:Rha family transcriptional regulator [Paenibacillus elgii]
MSKLILNPEYRLYERSGQAFCSSRQVAEEFERRHDNVLQAIDGIAALKNQASTESRNGLSEELEKMLTGGQTIEQFVRENFFEQSYKDASGKRAREVMVTRKGAMLVVMGFTGRKATAVKIGLLNRFEAMEGFIRSLQIAKAEFPLLTEAIKNAKEDPKHYHFSNEINMIYRIVLGMDAKAFRESHGIAKGEVIKPHLTLEQIQAVETLQRVDIGLIVAVPDFENRKQLLMQYYERMKLKLIA